MTQSVHGGHRERMREKFLRHGADVFETHELLEMLLYTKIPYRDTNPVAHELLMKTGGTLDGVFGAEKDVLTSVDGIGESVADFLVSFGKVPVGAVAFRVLSDTRSFADPDTVGKYLVERFRGKTTSETVLLALDNRSHLIRSETVTETDLSSAAVKPRAFIEAAVGARASEVILAHNHPYGAALFTEGDLASFRALRDALGAAGIPVVADYVVSGTRYVSNLTGAIPRVAGADGPAEDTDAPLVRALSVAFPEGVAKDAARALLSRYADIEQAIAAPLAELFTVPDLDRKIAFYLKLAAAVSARRRVERFRFGNVPSTEGLFSYLIALFDGVPVETVVLLCFDAAGRITRADKIASGSVNVSSVNRRKILETVVGAGASGAVIVHNHPLGAVTPSDADFRTTVAVRRILGDVGVRLIEHYIVAGSEVAGISDYSEDSIVAAADLHDL